MKLRDVIVTMQSGELSNLSFWENGELKADKVNRLITSINLGLTDLHTRFLLKLGSMNVAIVEGQLTYPLLPQYQVGNKAPAGTIQFIHSDEKLKDNLLKVQRVLDAHGRELGQNDYSTHRSVSFISSKVMQVPSQLAKEMNGTMMRVEFRKNANLIKSCDGEPDLDCIEVEIDYTHLNALCLFVASRLHNPSGFGTGGVHEGNNYAAKYEAECIRLEAVNTSLSYQAENTKRIQKGFP